MADQRTVLAAELFKRALDRPEEQRATFLDEACGDDVELHREVESLLKFNEGGDQFLEEPASDIAVASFLQAALKPNQRIGNYKILSHIDSGGMGEVYLARDEKLNRRVALKLVRFGIGGEETMRHFRREAQILASLNHPNIAQLYGAEITTEGFSFLVMEYVEGVRIDKYCHDNHLPIRDRLEMFRRVCGAVHYAHQRLIIHRDIKPANILITKEGEAKLLDFGIAKLLDPETPMASDQTMTFAAAMTPEYASPEQVRGEMMTTASDVYSLGVILYELLTGQRPYRIKARSPAEIVRAIIEQEPMRPSTALGRLASSNPQSAICNPKSFGADLDNIVLKAMRKEPQRRYSSVAQFSEDILRHLQGRTVIAHKDTIGYRTRKFVVRHRAGVGAAALIALSLVAGVVATLWQATLARHQARIATQERDHARTETAKAQRINQFLQEMIGYSAGTTPGSPSRPKGRDATVIDMLDDASKRVETELIDQPEVKAEMLSTIGTTYMVLANYGAARRFLPEAYDLNLKLCGPEGRSTATVMYRMANLSYLTGDYAAAESWIRKALPVYRRETTKADFEFWLLPAILSDAAFIMRSRGRLDEAEALWRECLSYAPRLDAKHRASAENPKTFLAQLYMDRGDVRRAEGMASEATQRLRAQGNPFALAQSLIDLGNVRRFQRRYAEAESLIDEGTKLFAKSQGEDHPNVAFGLTSLATAHYYEGRYDLAEQDARRAFAIAQKLPKGSHYYARASVVLGEILNKTGRPTEAEPLLREAVAVLKARVPSQSTVMAIALGGLGECLMTEGRYADGEPLLTESYNILKKVNVPESPALEEARQRLVALFQAWGKPQQAARYSSQVRSAAR
jgi:tetratricopeptide (TPR) repeat protein/tRNA A-37 threonylcarbamoyl transferase component Bud32